MRRWASLLVGVALMSSACGPAAGWRTISADQVATGGGLTLRLVSSEGVIDSYPWRKPPPGSACVHYLVEAAAVDGARHELRAEQFQAGGESPAQAVGQCNAGQLEPTWVGSQPVVVPITLVVPVGTGLPDLRWRP